MVFIIINLTSIVQFHKNLAPCSFFMKLVIDVSLCYFVRPLRSHKIIHNSGKFKEFSSELQRLTPKTVVEGVHTKNSGRDEVEDANSFDDATHICGVYSENFGYRLRFPPVTDTEYGTIVKYSGGTIVKYSGGTVSKEFGNYVFFHYSLYFINNIYLVYYIDNVVVIRQFSKSRYSNVY